MILISLTVLTGLNCDSYNSEKEWVENFITKTPTVYDSLLIHDSNFLDSMDSINFTRGNYIEYFESYGLDFEIYSIIHVHYDEATFLVLRVDARNDKQKCSFFFKKEEGWVFSHVMFEDYDIIINED